MKLILLVMVLLLSGCANVLLEPSKRIHQDQHQKYLEYVEADESMTERDKRYQRELIKRYGDLLKELDK